jgi:hypothetical protein
MISVPITFFIIIAAIYIQQWLNQREFSIVQKILLYFSVVLIGIELYTSVILWRISGSALYFGSQPIGLNLASIANHPDPSYEAVLMLGLALAVITTVFLAYQVLRERILFNKK